MKNVLKIAIVEDSPIDQDILSSFTKEYLFEKDISCITDIFGTGRSILNSQSTYDLIFLDMYLPDMLGTEVLAELRKKGVDSQVIFSTSSKDFIEQSYEADALHYLVKPVDKKKIGYDFPISNIIYIESYRHKCIVHTLTNEIEITEPISEVEVKLVDYDFVKVNRTTICNMRYIEEVTSCDVVLTSKVFVSISRNNKAEIKTKISDYRNKQTQTF